MRLACEQPLRIGLIASATQTVEEPFAGGMEAHTAALSSSLRSRGHEVTIHAASSSRPRHQAALAAVGPLRLSASARRDVSMPSEAFMAEHHAYLSLMLGLDELGYDVVHNNCLHYLPVAMAPSLRTPMLTTLHSPPTPWLESAIQCGAGRRGSRWISVSRTNARAWEHLCDPCEVVYNGIDLEAWRLSTAVRSGAVWSGRIVPEKGLHLASAAARRAGMPLAVAGPIGDHDYFEHCLLDADSSVYYHGHLDARALAELVGGAEVALVSPCWEEPFGLVAIEALACGTPVAGFARGALPEIVDARVGALARPDDAEDLAAAIALALERDPAACRARVRDEFSLEVMTDRYLSAYQALL